VSETAATAINHTIRRWSPPLPRDLKPASVTPLAPMD